MASIGNGAKILQLEKGRKSPEHLLYIRVFVGERVEEGRNQTTEEPKETRDSRQDREVKGDNREPGH